MTPVSLALLLLGPGCGSASAPDAAPQRDAASQAAEAEEFAAEGPAPVRQTARPQLQSSDAFTTLEATSRRLIAENGPPTHNDTPVEDSPESRQRLAYVAALSDATGLDFLKLATLQQHEGMSGLDRLIDTFNDQDPGAAEARRLQSVVRLSSSRHSEDSKKYLETLNDPALKDTEQQALWLDTLAEAWLLRAGGKPVKDPSAASYPAAARCAEATELSFEQLALIQRKGGTKGLRAAIELFPELPHRSDCLKALKAR